MQLIKKMLKAARIVVSHEFSWDVTHEVNAWLQLVGLHSACSFVFAFGKAVTEWSSIIEKVLKEVQICRFFFFTCKESFPTFSNFGVNLLSFSVTLDFLTFQRRKVKETKKKRTWAFLRWPRSTSGGIAPPKFRPSTNSFNYQVWKRLDSELVRRILGSCFSEIYCDRYMIATICHLESSQTLPLSQAVLLEFLSSEVLEVLEASEPPVLQQFQDRSWSRRSC